MGDVFVTRLSPGTVGIYVVKTGGVIPESGDPVMAAVLAACDDKTRRPLTDNVQVLPAVASNTTIAAQYWIAEGDQARAASIQEMCIRDRSPGTHELETRWVTDTIDTSTGAASVSANKEIVKGFAKSLEGGTLENNASQEANLVLEVAYYKYIQDGETLIEIDKLNNVFLVNGVDYGQAVRDNL